MVSSASRRGRGGEKGENPPYNLSKEPPIYCTRKAGKTEAKRDHVGEEDVKRTPKRFSRGKNYLHSLLRWEGEGDLEEQRRRSATMYRKRKEALDGEKEKKPFTISFLGIEGQESWWGGPLPWGGKKGGVLAAVWGKGGLNLYSFGEQKASKGKRAGLPSSGGKKKRRYRGKEKKIFYLPKVGVHRERKKKKGSW